MFPMNASFLRGLRVALLIIIISILGVASAVQADTTAKKYGLWIEAEGRTRPLNNKDDLNRLLAILRTEPLTDVYVQVYRHGRSWFPSLVADDAPYLDLGSDRIDPLRSILNVAAERSIRVHAWINALRLGHDADAKVFRRLREEDVLVDSNGVSLFQTRGYGLDGCRPDTPGIWLDPQSTRVQRLLEMVVGELIARYPELSGVHLDMIRTTFRLPGSFGGGDKNCEGFLRSGGPSRNLDPLDASAVVKAIHQYLQLNAPHMELSAAVLSNQSRAISHASQNWPKWIADGLVDSVVTMSYSADIARFKKEVRAALTHGEKRILIGIGAWLALNKPSVLDDQLRFVEKTKAAGYVLFSHANLDQKKGANLYAIAATHATKLK